MYQPPQFVAKDKNHALDLMRDYPFASLISNDDEGRPYVTHLPLHLEQRDDQCVLLGHVAKPNQHWKYLAARPEALVTFMGPYAYLSPHIYPDLVRVPSWNYLTVHANVTATLIEDAQGKDRLLKKLIGDHEPAYKQQWIDLGAAYQHKMLAGIVGFELAIRQLDGKLKLNQHRPESHAKMHAMYAAGNDNERALASWMARLGMVA
ncbi:MAG: FMN-binding negative transcriptional regulator [Cytophagales bacterium]|nr:FMN-binding negative transcriptional regulator [Cytophagales bacterium]